MREAIIRGLGPRKISQIGDRIMLEFKVRGENIEVTDAMTEYIEKRLSRLERYLNAVSYTHLTLPTKSLV